MWIEKATKDRNNEEEFFKGFFNLNVIDDIKIVSKKNFNDASLYHIRVHNFVKNVFYNYYFNDFTIMIDADNPNGNNMKKIGRATDDKWQKYISLNLNKEDNKQYKNAIKEHYKKIYKAISEKCIKVF